MAVTSKPGSVTDKIAVDQLEVKPRAGGSVLADAAVKSGKPAAQMKRKKDEEDELQNLKDDVGATAEDVAGEWVDGQEGPMLLAQAETSGAAGSASGGGAAGTGAAAGSAAGAEAAGAAALSDAALGTIILGGVVGVAVIASTGGAAAAAAPAAVGFILSGTIVAGAVIDGTGLTVEAFKADGTQLAGGTATINNNGSFTINITENYSGPVLVRVVDNSAGADYTDEGTGNTVDLTVDLRAMVNVSGNGTITVNVTPVTELAVRELVGDAGGDGGTSVTTLGATVTTTQVTAANTAVQNALGLTSDIVATAPVTVDVGTPNLYGQVLAAIAGAEVNLGADTGTVLNTLAQGISGSTVDQAVIDLLIAGAVVADGVAGNATGTATALTTLIGSNISAIDISADTGSATDFITQTAAQTITATLDTALTGTKLWGSVDGGTTWTDISSFVTTTSLSWTGVTLSGSSFIKLAVTANTVTAFTGAAADVVGNISVQSYSVDATAPAFTSATAANFAENGTATAYTAAATDAHLLAYTKSGADTALFNLDPNSGAVTFISAPNFEVPADAGGDNVYNITVTATDGAGNATNQAVAITVTDVNEMPTLTSGTAASFAENATGTVYTATATDPEAATLTYALGGADAARFAINANTGAVTFAATPNFEAPADAGGDNVYNITVTASDGTNTTSAQAVAITVTNVNEIPTLTSGAAASFAENATGTVYTAAATDPEAATLTYALGGADAALFAINGSTGAVTFAAAPNFEIPADAGGNNVYDITVTASDGTNTTTPQAVAVTVTNVNETPTVASGAPTTDTIVVGQALVGAEVASLFTDVDAGDTLTYSQTGLPAELTLDPSTGAITGTPVTTGTTNITFTATDAGSLSVNHTIAVSVVAAPTITSTIDNVTNFDVTSNIVLTASENVTAVATKYIHIINDGGTGFHGEATVNTQDILVTSAAVTITNNTITINPGFDLDLANNYHIEVDAGAFLGVTSGQDSVAIADSTTMNFSTVTPGSATGGVAGAAASQKMGASDAMVASYGWWDIETLGSTVSGAVSGDLSAGNIAAVFKDYDPLPGDAGTGYTGIGSPGDDYVSLLNFGAGDLLYVDNQTNTAPNDLTQTAIIHSGVAPVQLQFDGYTPNGGQPIWVDITTTAGTTAFNDVAGLQSLLSLAYVPIVSA